MADTIDVFILTDEVWVDAYAQTLIPVGTALSIQNQSSHPIKVHIGATVPLLDAISYVSIPDKLESIGYIDANGSGCWLLGRGQVSVQED